MAGPGSRLIFIGVLLFALSVGTLVWSSASEWLHQSQRPAAPRTESLPERFNLVTPAVVRATSVAP